MKKRGTYSIEEIKKTLNLYHYCYDIDDEDEDELRCTLYICDKHGDQCVNCIDGVEFQLIPAPLMSGEPQRYYLMMDDEYHLLSSVINCHQLDCHYMKEATFDKVE